MKLGEALNERARLARRVNELRDLLGSSLLVTEGEEPAVDADDTINEIMDVIEAIEALSQAINLTNAESPLAEGDGRTITQALAERDARQAKVKLLDYAITGATGSNDPFYRRAAELKTERKVSVTDLRERRANIELAQRKLETLLQSANWSLDLKHFT